MDANINCARTVVLAAVAGVAVAVAAFVAWSMRATPDSPRPSPKGAAVDRDGLGPDQVPIRGDDDLEARLAKLSEKSGALRERMGTPQERLDRLRAGPLPDAGRRRLQARFAVLPSPKALRDPGPGAAQPEGVIPQSVLEAYETETGIPPERFRRLMDEGVDTSSTP